MSITCLLSHTSNDLRCPICGQGFLVFAERASAAVREQIRRRVKRAMRMHHAGAGASQVHPTDAFPVEEENTTLANLFSALVPRTFAAAC